jgi:aryl-alcohol dehydrogenase-like predicted oxidoreductase
MVRAGLLVGAEILEAAERLVARLRPTTVWGMSPFGGNTDEPVWDRFDARVFLRDPQSSNPLQAAFRAAYRLPVVDTVAVGTDDVDHLRMLTEALKYQVDNGTVREYRALLSSRRQPA